QCAKTKVSEAQDCSLKEDFILAHGRAAPLTNLALTLRAQGKYAEAEEPFRQALAILEKALPAGHPDLATSLNNLATTLHAQGQYAEAEKLYRQALAIREKALPAGHPLLATSLNNLADTLYEQGQYAEAEKLHREAIRLQPGYPQAHNNLGLALHAQRR